MLTGATTRMCSSERNTGQDDATVRALVGKLLILRLTTRGLCRPRLCSAGTATISSRISSTMRRRRRGGKRGMERQMPPDNPHRVEKGQHVGIAAGVLASLMDQLPQGEVGEQQAMELPAPPDPPGGYAASAAGRASSPSARRRRPRFPNARGTRRLTPSPAPWSG